MPFPDQACTAFAQISDQNTDRDPEQGLAVPVAIDATTTTPAATTTATAPTSTP